MPRPFSKAENSFKSVADSFNACSNGLNVDQSGVMDKIKECVGQAQIPANLKTQADCLLTKDTADRLGCVVQGDARVALERYKACVAGAYKNCALDAALPPGLACIPGAKTIGDLTCLEGEVGDAVKTAQCLTDNTQNYVAKINCVAGDNIPPAITSVLSCYGENTTEAAMALCVLGKNLPPKQALYIRCAVESGGDFFAAGVCVAAPTLNLSPGQQILLQCAMASGGEPVTFAGCSIGQFTFREFQKCKKVDFGESGCFGPSNEFQRLAKALTGKTINENSVVGQIASFSIESVNGAFSSAGNALSQIGKGAKNAERGFRHELDKISDDPVGAAWDAPGNVFRETYKGLVNVRDEGERFYKKRESKVKSWLKKRGIKI